MNIRMGKNKLLMYLLIVITFMVSCKKEKKEAKEVNSTDVAKSEWIYLFDGKTTNGWRAYNGDSLPDEWVIKDGALTFDTEKRLESERKGGKDIIYTAEEFDNFELYLEWKLPEGGNSGILYHIKEGNWGPPEVAPEYQLLDDLKWEEINNAKLESWQKTGADYAMYAPDTTQKIVKPAGEWNTSKIRFTPELVEHWLNGKKIVSFKPWSKDWEERKQKGKWKDYTKYGTFKSGYIGLQDHDSPLWFKNIKIKRL
ncbi:DUF1080 domain-containing protein [Croceitalea sp. MTPC9]|nr:DUF1080 domain-containing protein [Croceitalea sp. MTPC6]GMN17864.1 DUF1080 domain-containing protein [Croceitalea sp. MTPC9]